MTTLQLQHGLSDVINLINGSPLHLWFTVGVVVASLPVTALVVEWYKRHHFKVNATELTNHAIDFVVAVTATLMTLADFVIANGTNLSHFFPFLITVMPTITAFAPHVYDISRAVHGWFVNRQNESQQQRIANTIKLANSFGTESNGLTGAQTAPASQQPPQPASKVIQL